MKILFATPIYPPEIGGPATYTKELAERLRTDHQITILAYTTKHPETITGVDLIFVDKLKLLPYRLFRFLVAALRQTKKADIIYVQNAVAAGLPAVLAGIIRRKPVVVKFVGDEAWERAYSTGRTKKLLVDFLRHPEGGFKIWIFRKIQEFVLRHAALVTTPSQYLGKEIAAAYGINPAVCVTNYNAAAAERHPFTVQKRRHQLLTTARLVPWKGIGGIIEAVALLQNKIPDIQLVIAGEGPEMEMLKQRADRLGVGNAVRFVGKVSRAQTRYLREESEIYILNSLYEGLPHTVLSSFSAGIPVIATDIPGTNEAVYDGTTGLLVPHNDSQKLAAAIEKLLGDKMLQQKLVDGATKLLQEKFSWEAHINSLLRIFHSVLPKPGN